MITFTCDHCGKPVQTNTGMHVTTDRNSAGGMLYGRERFDLCDECAGALLKFMSGAPGKEADYGRDS